MKTGKYIIMGVCASMLFTSCSTTESGAMSGAYFGGVLGSAVGGLMGGYRGHNVGTIVGMATGAAVGAAAGNANEQKRVERIQRYHDGVYQRSHKQNNRVNRYDDSGFDESNSGDDRIYDFQSSDYTGSYSASQPKTVMPHQSTIEDVSLRNLTYSNALEIRNARFVDSNNDKVLKRGESGKVIFEITNVSDNVMYDIVPTVIETTGNKHILISPSVHIEQIAPRQTLRYTAMVQATKSLKNGTANIALSVVQGNRTIGKVTEFSIDTAKK